MRECASVVCACVQLRVYTDCLIYGCVFADSLIYPLQQTYFFALKGMHTTTQLDTQGHAPTKAT